MGADVTDIGMLVDWENLGGIVGQYLPDKQSIVPASAPWPMIWLLARFHPMHRFCGSGFPSTNNVIDHVNLKINRIKWSSVLRQKQVAETSDLGHRISRMISKKVAPATCGRLVDPALRSFPWILRTSIAKAINSARTRYKSSSIFSNKSPLVRLGMRLLAASNFTAVRNDKDKFYTLVDNCHLSMIADKLLATGWYRPISANCAMVQSASKQYTSLCKRVEIMLDCPGMAARMTRSYTGLRSIVSKIIFTVMAHKDEGDISIRSIHSTPSYGFLGLSIWVSSELRSHLKNCHHLVDNMFKFARVVDGMRFQNNWFFANLDVKDFFMSGTANDITDDLHGWLPKNKKTRLLVDAVRFLLDYQFVSFTGDHAKDDFILCVIFGSGMGLFHSCDLMDLIFFIRVEFILLRPQILAKYGIIKLWRYRDDLLLVGSHRGIGPNSTTVYVSKMRKLAKYFKITVDRVSSTSTTFVELDLNICDGVVRVVHRLKDTAHIKPLSTTSAHNSAVHRSWPDAIVRRALQLTSTSCRSIIVDKLKTRLSHSLASPATTFFFDESFRKSQAARPPRPLNPPLEHKVWISLPYHPCLETIIANVLLKLSMDHQMLLRLAFNSDKKVALRCSWKATLQSLDQFTRKVGRWGSRMVGF